MTKPLTLDEAKRLRVGQALYHRYNRNADGTAQKWRVNAKVRTWERDPSKVKISVKSGTYLYDTITENELNMVSLEQPQVIKGAGIKSIPNQTPVIQSAEKPKSTRVKSNVKKTVVKRQVRTRT
jgi:hypothetical protein